MATLHHSAVSVLRYFRKLCPFMDFLSPDTSPARPSLTLNSFMTWDSQLPPSRKNTSPSCLELFVCVVDPLTSQEERALCSETEVGFFPG